MADTKIPQAVGPMLDQVSTLINSIPKDKLSGLIDESFNAFNGAGYDLGSLFDSSSQDLRRSQQSRRPVDRRSSKTPGRCWIRRRRRPDALRTWARSLAGVTGQVVANDPQVRTLLQEGPPAANEVSRLLDQVKPTLPVLLANLTTFGQVAVTYHPSLEQVLVLLPPFVGDILSSAPENNPTGMPLGDFRIQIGDRPAVHGRLPAAVAVAVTSRPDDDRYAGRLVLQAATGLADRRARSAQLAVHGCARQARPDGAGVLQRQAVYAAGDAATCAGAVSAGSEPDRPGHSAG